MNNYQSLYYRQEAIHTSDLEERLNKAIEAKLTNKTKPQFAMIYIKTPNKTTYVCKRIGGVK